MPVIVFICCFLLCILYCVDIHALYCIVLVPLMDTTTVPWRVTAV